MEEPWLEFSFIYGFVIKPYNTIVKVFLISDFLKIENIAFVSFLVTNLLRYNSHTIHTFKWYSSWLLAHLPSYTSSSQSLLGYLHYSKRNLPTLPFLLSHSLPLGLGKHSSVFCHYDVPTLNIFIQMEPYVVLCDWLFHLACFIVYPCCGMYQYFISCYCQILFYCTPIKWKWSHSVTSDSLWLHEL